MGHTDMETTWYYELKYPGRDTEWESGFESYDDAYEAMSERMTEMIDEMVDEGCTLSDEDIESKFDWEVREE